MIAVTDGSHVDGLPALPSDYFAKPSPARMWNYLQGGKDNYPLDRRAGEIMAASYPDIFYLARQCRLFLARAVRLVASEGGVRQFLDLGCGLPAPPDLFDLHLVAQRVHRDARVVYLDNDKAVLAHARALMTSSTDEGVCVYVESDARNIDYVLNEARQTLDFDRPIGVVLFGLLGAIGLDEAMALVARLRDEAAGGSYFMINDSVQLGEEMVRAQERRRQTGIDNYTLRTPEQFAAYFEGLELMDPGIVPCTLWRPGLSLDRPRPVDSYGGVGRKP